MKLLLIEDDNNKSKQIINSIREVYLNNANISEAHSFQKGMKKIRTENYDCLLLDMTLPTYDIDTNHSGGTTKKFGGMEILEEMKMRDLYLKTIIITQHEDFDGVSLESINSDYKDKFLEFKKKHNMSKGQEKEISKKRTFGLEK